MLSLSMPVGTETDANTGSNNDYIATTRPYLGALLAVPPPADHVVARGHLRHVHLVDDCHVRSGVAAALAVLQRRLGPRPAAVWQLRFRVVPPFVAGVGEADVARLIAPAVLIASRWWLELRRLLVALPPRRV